VKWTEQKGMEWRLMGMMMCSRETPVDLGTTDAGRWFLLDLEREDNSCEYFRSSKIFLCTLDVSAVSGSALPTSILTHLENASSASKQCLARRLSFSLHKISPM